MGWMVPYQQTPESTKSADEPTGPGRVASALLRWTRDGGAELGEVRIRVAGGGGFLIHHVMDNPESCDLTCHSDPAEARLIAADDADGNYRPLKSAPTLRRGWLLQAASAESAVDLLNCLYPGALGLAEAHERGDLAPTPLRETLDRQTGMYKVAGKISDADAECVAGATCSPNRCVKIILWTMRTGGRSPAQLPKSKTTLPHSPRAAGDILRIPLLCREACNFLVADARRHVKRAATATVTPGTGTG